MNWSISAGVCRPLSWLLLILIGAALSAAPEDGRTERRREYQAGFDAASENRILALEREIRGHLNLVSALARAMGKLDGRERYHLLVVGAEASPGYSFRWISVVPLESRRSFEEGLDGANGIWETDETRQVPAQARPIYYPITAVAPNQHKSMVGFDLGFRPENLSAILRAETTSSLAVTASFPLIHQSDKETGVVTFHPVQNVARKGELAGFLSSVMNLRQVVHNGLLALKPYGIHIELWDITTEPHLMYQHESRRPNRPAADGITPYVSVMTVGGRKWQFRCFPSAPSRDMVQGSGIAAGLALF